MSDNPSGRKNCSAAPTTSPEENVSPPENDVPTTSFEDDDPPPEYTAQPLRPYLPPPIGFPLATIGMAGGSAGSCEPNEQASSGLGDWMQQYLDGYLHRALKKAIHQHFSYQTADTERIHNFATDLNTLAEAHSLRPSARPDNASRITALYGLEDPETRKELLDVAIPSLLEEVGPLDKYEENISQLK